MQDIPRDRDSAAIAVFVAYNQAIPADRTALHLRRIHHLFAAQALARDNAVETVGDTALIACQRCTRAGIAADARVEIAILASE